ncbi:hypothetical protein EMCRGX_G034138 [Ephydatia muelleri]
MSILGRGSMRDKGKEEELRNGTDPAYQHLKENLHIVIEATGPHSVAKLAAGVAEVRKMLIPSEPGAPDPVEVQGGKVQGREEEGLAVQCEVEEGVWLQLEEVERPAMSETTTTSHQLVALQLVLAMVLSPPSQVMEGTLPLLRTMVMTRTMREMATMAALQTHEEMLAMIEEEVEQEMIGRPRVLVEETIVPILTISSSHQHPIFECLESY